MSFAEEFNSNFRLMIIVLLITSVVFYITDNIHFSTINNSESLINGKLVNITSFGSTKEIIKYNLSDVHISYDFNPNLYNSMKWLSELSNKNNKRLVVFNWWPEGHYINAFTNFKALLYSPSSDYLLFMKNPKWNTITLGGFADRSILRSVDYALVSDKPELLIDAMKKYNASILYVTIRDVESESEMYSYLRSRYLLNLNTSFVDKSNLYKALSGNFLGLNLIYKDKYTAIYSTQPLSSLVNNSKHSVAKKRENGTSSGKKNSYPGIVI